jgi:hypothetical protein
MTFTEFGYTGTNTNTVNYTLLLNFTPASTVSVNQAGVRIKTVGSKCKIAIATGDLTSGSWVTGTKEIASTVDGWNDVTFDASVTLTGGTEYYIGIVSDDSSFEIYSDPSTPYMDYNNNTNYKYDQYSQAFDASTQGQPVIKAHGSQRQNGRYGESSTPVSSGTRLPPPPIVVHF